MCGPPQGRPLEVSVTFAVCSSLRLTRIDVRVDRLRTGTETKDSMLYGFSLSASLSLSRSLSLSLSLCLSLFT